MSYPAAVELIASRLSQVEDFPPVRLLANLDDVPNGKYGFWLAPAQRALEIQYGREKQRPFHALGSTGYLEGAGYVPFGKLPAVHEEPILNVGVFVDRIRARLEADTAAKVFLVPPNGLSVYLASASFDANAEIQVAFFAVSIVCHGFY